MRVVVREHEGCFGIELDAETPEEMAVLVRMGMNATSDLRHFSTSVYESGCVTTSIVLGKHRRADALIPRRR